MLPCISNVFLDLVTPENMHQKNVFTIMRKDEISDVAQGDELIGALGDVWISKSMDNRLICCRSRSFRMRLAARLLIEVRRLLGVPDMTLYELLI